MASAGLVIIAQPIIKAQNFSRSLRKKQYCIIQTYVKQSFQQNRLTSGDWQHCSAVDQNFSRAMHPAGQKYHPEGSEMQHLAVGDPVFHLVTLQLQQVLNKRINDLVIALIKEHVKLLHKLQHFCANKQFFKKLQRRYLCKLCKEMVIS